MSTRLTPRDANWVPEAEGGTGRWDGSEKSSNGTSTVSSSTTVAKTSLSRDDECIMAVLRPELVASYTQMKIGEYLREKENEKASSEGAKKATPEVAHAGAI